MPTLGLDIGGANLKAATSNARAAAAAFPLWKSPNRLADELRRLVAPLSIYQEIGVTMTGELADCFAAKAEGVSRILSAVEEFAQGIPVFVWSTDGEFLNPNEARDRWSAVAAANWHVLATWAARFAPKGPALLIDVGSTTTDVIPLADGVPCPVGRNDVDRLLHGELVYTGVRRTPVCAVLAEVDFRGRRCPLAAELFATMLDAHLITGSIADDPDDRDTADARPSTMECARDRLARMLCCDRTEILLDELKSLARQFVAAQQRQIRVAIADVVSRQSAPPETVLVSGSGAFVAHRVIDERRLGSGAVRVVDFGRELTPTISHAACAFSVATLLAERGGR